MIKNRVYNLKEVLDACKNINKEIEKSERLTLKEMERIIFFVFNNKFPYGFKKEIEEIISILIDLKEIGCTKREIENLIN